MSRRRHRGIYGLRREREEPAEAGWNVYSFIARARHGRSSGATRGWVRMNGRLTGSFKNAVAADFDGKGRTDIAVDEGSRWRYSRDGRASLTVRLPNRGGPGPPGPLKKMVIGRFDSTPSVRLVTFGPLKQRGQVAQHDDRLVAWDAQVCCFGVLSQQDMR